MTPQEDSKIIIIGSGAVASHLGLALDQVGHVTQVFSPNYMHASDLASVLKDCTPIDSFSEIDINADFYVISIKDDALVDVAMQMPKVSHGTVVHTSGSVPIDVLAPLSDNYGVMYPLQTFTKGVDVDMSKTPIFTEGNNQSSLMHIDQIARAISHCVRHADSYQRLVLHLSAVFACNFANHLWNIASEILKTVGYDFNVLTPLLEATLAKASTQGPAASQTGPAARGDACVIAKHISMLDKGNAEIYRMLSQSILNRKNIDLNI